MPGPKRLHVYERVCTCVLFGALPGALACAFIASALMH